MYESVNIIKSEFCALLEQNCLLPPWYHQTVSTALVYKIKLRSQNAVKLILSIKICMYVPSKVGVTLPDWKYE